MKSTWAGLGWLALAACLPLRAGAADDGRPAFEARLVEEELALAKTQSYYFLLDLGAKRLDLRVSGSPLRSWDLAQVRVWGEPAALTATALVKKTALRPPERTVIKPGGEEEPAPAPPPAKKGTAGETPAPAFELEALELKDMPPVFRMSFDDGFDVSIVTGDQGFKGRAGKLWNEIRWSVGMPLLSLRAKLGKQAFRKIEITLKDKLDAQALYWAFYEGIKGLVWYYPSD
jgi:hypothetical protein